MSVRSKLPVVSEQPAVSRTDALSRAHVLLIRYTVDLTRLAEATLGPQHAGNRDVQIMLALSSRPGSTPSELAEALGTTRSGVSHRLQGLQQEGLVDRSTDTRDRRSARLRLTSKGVRRVRAFEDAVGRRFQVMAAASLEVVELLRPGTRATATVSPLELASQLGGAGARYVGEVVPLLAAYGVVDATDRFALTLIRHFGAPRPSRLAHELDLTYGGLSAVLDRLERAGLVLRTHRPDLGDRRTILITLTERGDQAAMLALDVLDRHSDAMCSVLSQTALVAWSSGAA